MSGAAYNRALHEGMAEEQSIYYADKAIRSTQGSASAKDLAAVATGQGQWGQALKLMTLFYSYVSTVYQRQRTLARDARRAKRTPENQRIGEQVCRAGRRPEGPGAPRRRRGRSMVRQVNLAAHRPHPANPGGANPRPAPANRGFLRTRWIAALFALSNRMANLINMRPNDEFYLLGRVAKK